MNISFPFKDDDVAILKGCKSLRILKLENADLTEFGALNLASVVPLREVNRGAFNDAGLKAFRDHRSDVKIVD